MSRAPHYFKEYNVFAGVARVIPNDEDNNVSFDEPPQKTREPPHSMREKSSRKTRECSEYDKTREQETSIPYSNSDFLPINTTPLSSQFYLPTNPQAIKEGPSVAATRRKQLCLLTIYETIGHLSFATLKLMTKCGIIPRELGNVDPPTCPGCAYGEAYRLQWRYKGSRNLKSIRTATSPGQTVSVDQLISHTQGFVPIHQGLPTKK